MVFRTPQSNFSKGEIGPQLYGRYDVDAWRSAVKRARNVVVMKFGGLEKRPGFELVGEVLLDNLDLPVRLIPFQFSREQAYAIEMGQAYFGMSAHGGRVLEEELTITAITAGAQTTITAAFHGYTAGNLVFIQGVEGEMGDRLNNQFWRVVSAPTDDTFVIAANTSGLPFTGAEGGDTRTEAPDPVTTPTVPAPAPAPTPPSTSPPGGGGGGFRGFEQQLEQF